MPVMRAIHIHKEMGEFLVSLFSFLYLITDNLEINISPPLLKLLVKIISWSINTILIHMILCSIGLLISFYGKRNGCRLCVALAANEFTIITKDGH